MKGLILKDWRLMFRQMRLILVFVLIFVGFFSFTMDGVNFLPGFYTGICLMMTINCFSYDEMSGFDKLVASSPIPRHKVVLARYITAFLTGLIGMIAILIVQAVTLYIKGAAQSIWLNSLVVVASLGFSLLLIMVVFPLFYKFGVNKSRVLFIILFMIPAALVGIVTDLLNTPDNAPFALSQTFLDLLPVFFIALLIIGFFLSYTISVNIYLRKEF